MSYFPSAIFSATNPTATSPRTTPTSPSAEVTAIQQELVALETALGTFFSSLLANTAMTGNPTATTQSSADNSTRLATTAYVTTAIANSTSASQTLTNKNLTSGTNTFPTFNQSTSGTAAGLSSTLVVGSGGTGATTLTGLVKGNGTSAMTAVTAPSGTVVGTSDTQTLTNKRVTKRVLRYTTDQGATPAINTDSYDVVHMTGQTTAITGFAMTGTPVDGDTLRISINSTNTGLSFAGGSGASFESSTTTLPGALVASTRLDIVLVWNTETPAWRCVGVS